MAKQVQFHRVTKNPLYNNFIIAKSYISDDVIKFVYEEDGVTVEKLVPTTYWIQHCREKIMWKDDELTLKKKYSGMAYEIKAEPIFAFNDSAVRKEQTVAVQSDWDALASMGIIINKK
jgi:hypothetical protein